MSMIKIERIQFFYFLIPLSLGELIKEAKTDEFLAIGCIVYKSTMSAVPRITSGHRKGSVILKGESLHHPPTGSKFHKLYSLVMGLCKDTILT